MNKSTPYILFLFVLVSAVAYFSESPEEILGKAANLTSEEEGVIPFALARGTVTTHYQKDGSINYTFNADRLEHYRQQNESREIYTLVENPQLVIYQDDEPWFVNARKGKIFSPEQEIELWSKVQIDHTNFEGLETKIETEKLMIDPNNKVANTEESVKISADTAVIEGRGMDANMKTERLRLLSNVRGVYEPK
ncbi:MAG: LPS export ABC transporter periplasmic protein LptC [Agarilytica sp.]